MQPLTTLIQHKDNPEHQALLKRFWKPTNLDRDCLHCGDPFYARSNFQKFCCLSCSITYHNAKRTERAS